MLGRLIKVVGRTLLFLTGLVGLAWLFGALWFDLPLPAGGRKAMAVIVVIGLLGLWWSKRKQVRQAAALLVFALLAWWFSQRPSNDRHWMPDVAQTAWAEINGDEVTLHNVRNFDYRSENDSTPRWETRRVRLSQLTGLDIVQGYWGSPWMAHPIISFQFADAPPVCFSIETRKEVGESYSAIGGIYRQYELIYIVADERDVVRLRTNYRPGEDLYLYRTTLTAERARQRFHEYLNALNALHDKPRWYNALTTNCTTSIRNQRDAAQRRPWDWRILLNGKADEMLYEQDGIVTGDLPFAELKKRAHVNEGAKQADQDPLFSQRIRHYLQELHP